MRRIRGYISEASAKRVARIKDSDGSDSRTLSKVIRDRGTGQAATDDCN
jgi:hypothetical protein